MNDFGVDVSAWVKKAKGNPETIVRSTAIKLFSAIIESSPVDEGTFRANWFVSGIKPSGKTTSSTSAAGAVISRTNSDVEALTDWTAITFTNNLPYAKRLEYGYSGQAPNGMVRVNAIRFNTLIDEEARRL